MAGLRRDIPESQGKYPKTNICGAVEVADGRAWMKQAGTEFFAGESFCGANKMGANTFEVASNHVLMRSKPEFVLDVIRKAAKAVENFQKQ